MKKELGKWLMDIAKYMVTALLISSAFGDLDSPLMYAMVFGTSVITLGTGLFLVKPQKGED